MKIAIGADHAGFELKDLLRDALRAAGHEVEDLGTDSKASIDYPDYAKAVALKVSAGAAERGILVCASGVGMSIAANKVRGVRAALAVHEEEVRLARQHNNANVLTLGQRFTAPQHALAMVEVFLETPFDGGRHERRVKKMADMDAENGR
jgi:ribose 5-phosphate isomerase B